MIISKIKNMSLLMNKRAINKCLRKFSYVRWNIVFPFLLFCRGIRVRKKRIRSIFNVLKKKTCVTTIRLSSTDTVSLVADSSFFKFPLTEDSDKRIIAEFKNWKVAREIKDVLIIPDVEFIKYEEVSYLKMPLLQVIPENNRTQSYNFVLNSFYYQKSLCKTEMTDDIKHGCEIIKYLDFSDRQESFIIDFESRWLNLKAYRSTTHGDLHPGNIMQINGRYVLIDMDRFEINGFTGFDLIHLYLQMMETNIRGWMPRLKEITTEEIKETLNTDVFDSYSTGEWNVFKTAYWIDRIGKEQKYGEKFTPALREQTRSMLSFVKAQWINHV